MILRKISRVAAYSVTVPITRWRTFPVGGGVNRAGMVLRRYCVVEVYIDIFGEASIDSHLRRLMSI